MYHCELSGTLHPTSKKLRSGFTQFTLREDGKEDMKVKPFYWRRDESLWSLELTTMNAIQRFFILFDATTCVLFLLITTSCVFLLPPPPPLETLKHPSTYMN